MLWLEISYGNKGEKGVRSLLPGPPARDRDTCSLVLPVHKGHSALNGRFERKQGRVHVCRLCTTRLWSAVHLCRSVYLISGRWKSRT